MEEQFHIKRGQLSPAAARRAFNGDQTAPEISGQHRIRDWWASGHAAQSGGSPFGPSSLKRLNGSSKL
jgi:hypothetical protein